MDSAGLGGIGLAFAVIIGANIMEGGSPAALLAPAPMILVFGTTILVSIAGGTIADVKLSVRAAKRAMVSPVPSAGDVVPAVVSLAERARREGLLSLEDSLKDIDDPFLVKGVTMAVDGTDPEELREILESEVHAKRRRTSRQRSSSTMPAAMPPPSGSSAR